MMGKSWKLPLLAAALVLTTSCAVMMSDETDATSVGSASCPSTAVSATVYASDGLTAYAYPGSLVYIKFMSDSFTVDRVSIESPVTGGDTGLSVKGDGIVGGWLNCTARIVLTDGSAGTTKYAYVYAATPKDTVEIYTTSSCDVQLEVPDLEFVNVSMTSGSLPDGVTVSSTGHVTGKPAATGDYYFTLTGSYYSPESEEEVVTYSHFLISAVAPASVTKVSSTQLYAVEGETVNFTVNGSVSDGTAYSATLSTTGGTLSRTAAVNGTIVALKCPLVDEKTVITVTVTCDTPGAAESSKTVRITVADTLVVSAPVVGTVSSR